MSERYTLGPDIDLDVEDVRDSRGQRITNEYAEQAAQEALAYVRRGRPSLSGPGERSPQISFRIPEQLHRAAMEAAERQGMSVSELAREALARYLAEAPHH